MFNISILDRRDKDSSRRDRSDRDSERRHDSRRSSRREWEETPRFRDSPATPNIHVKGQKNCLLCCILIY